MYCTMFTRLDGLLHVLHTCMVWPRFDGAAMASPSVALMTGHVGAWECTRVGCWRVQRADFDLL